MRLLTSIAGVILAVAAPLAAEETRHDENHAEHKKNHIAFVSGLAQEQKPFSGGDHRGLVVGFEYIRLFKPDWGVGATFEYVSFDGAQTREAILAAPLSYFPADGWRLLVAPGVEFRERGDPEEIMLRLGVGYEFVFPNHMTLAPEAQLDLMPGGERVFVLALALGFGF